MNKSIITVAIILASTTHTTAYPQTEALSRQVSALQNALESFRGHLDGEISNLSTEIDYLKSGMAKLVPSGMVTAFRTSSCPSGWSPLDEVQGRFIVGAGELDSDNYKVGETGGSARHQLTIDEMPKHNHQAVRLMVYSTDDGRNDKCCFARGRTTTDPTSFSGGDKPHENRPPYLALLYCVKE